jgi:hypothetical protein
MDRFNPFRLPKPNRPVGAIKGITFWFRPTIKPWVTEPVDWNVIKLSGDRTGYVKTSDLHFA